MEQSAGGTKAVTRVREMIIDGVIFMSLFADMAGIDVLFFLTSLYSSFLLMNDVSIYEFLGEYFLGDPWSLQD